MISSDARKLIKTFEESNNITLPSKIGKKDLLKQIELTENIATLFALGNCFYFLMNFVDMKIDYVSNSVFEVLGIDKESVSVNKLLALWHPIDLNKMSSKEELVFRFLYEFIPTSDLLHYKVSYLNRLKSQEGTYKKILHQSTAISLSGDNKVERTFCVETDLDHLKIPMSDTITFLGMNGRPSFYSDDIKTIKPLRQKLFNLSAREIQILSLTSKGLSSKLIAAELNISLHTVSTHKKNILNKSNSNNMTHLISQLILKGVI